MGMAESEFFDCTPVYFARRRRAWLQDRPGMERARFVAFHVMKAGGYKIRRLRQICTFPWEQERRHIEWAEWDQAEMDAFSEQADELLRQVNPEQYARYMEGKARREQQQTPPAPAQEEGNEMQLNFELEL